MSFTASQRSGSSSSFAGCRVIFYLINFFDVQLSTVSNFHILWRVYWKEEKSRPWRNSSTFPHETQTHDTYIHERVQRRFYFQKTVSDDSITSQIRGGKWKRLKLSQSDVVVECCSNMLLVDSRELVGGGCGGWREWEWLEENKITTN